jgi:hypothetical protein
MSQSMEPSENSGGAPGKDIGELLREWDYEPGTINVRKILGDDGKVKIQMRVDLGLLQMELLGRPDGMRPHGCESLLEYHEKRLIEHHRANGTELGFHLTTGECQSLREEAVQYYHRYLSLFLLEDFKGVVRDTSRNLRVLDMCGQFAVEEHDRLILEQYRPYITMMNARAQASIRFQEQKYPEALALVEGALEKIREFFDRFGQADAYAQSNEVKVLRKFAREIRRKLPLDPVVRLQAQLDKAVREERYEDAARLRDQILIRRQSPPPQNTPESRGTT